jgi:flagellar biosynthesis chaperone FliJ
VTTLQDKLDSLETDVGQQVEALQRQLRERLSGLETESTEETAHLLKTVRQATDALQQQLSDLEHQAGTEQGRVLGQLKITAEEFNDRLQSLTTGVEETRDRALDDLSHLRITLRRSLTPCGRTWKPNWSNTSSGC